MWRPFARLRRAGYSAQWLRASDPRAPAIGSQVEAFLSPRAAYGVTAEKRQRARARLDRVHAEGRLSIYEIDDDLISEGSVDRLVTLHGKSRAEAEESADAHRWTVAQHDGVTVTTEALAEVIRRYTDKPVEVVPNAIDLEWFRGVQRRARRKVTGLTIGWQGGNRPDQDVALMAEAWRRVARRYPRVRFVVQGFVPETIRRIDLGGRLLVLPWFHVDIYPAGLMNVDVGCCPLSDTGFNRCKSPIKAFEWAANGSPVVASPLLYGDVIEDGRDGYIARTVDEWDGALSRLVESRSLRQDMARRLLRKVERRHSLEVCYEAWPRAWARIRESVR